MPLRSHGQTRKRWRYVGFYGPEVMLCAARAEVGPLGQCFWAIWDRDERRAFDHTSLRPGSTEVRMDGPEIAIDRGDVRVRLRLGEAAAIESICPSGAAWGWTRKRAGVPASGTIEAGGRQWQVEGLAVNDESAGYHQRQTSWHWSAGVGRAVDGRPVAWNLVEGINDPDTNSERAIWVDGEPFEPPPVRFRDVAAVEFPGERLLQFASESERARDDNLLLFRSTYSHRFGSFSGALGELNLAEGLGVMERHDARW
ncbi:MAG TPA: DUF2804 family protein [Solirubrobacterales bacterium]|jgi:hypothetical protein|nr:DUF2804 family protein [Solirubrobacterales bacterium]